MTTDKQELAPYIYDPKSLTTNPVVRALVAESQSCVAIAEAFEIDGPEMDQLAADNHGLIKKTIKSLAAEKKSAMDPLAKLREVISGWFAPHEKALAEASSIYEKKRVAYFEDQETKRLAAEEAARKAQQALLDKADKAEEKGKASKAEALREKAVAVELPPQTAPKVAGSHMRTYHKARCVSKLDLIKAIAQGIAPESLVEFSESAGNKYAEATNGSTSIPGLEFYTELKPVNR